MITQLSPFKGTASPNGRYGITERKKAELDHLTIQVLDAQYEVNQLQSIVTALTAKEEKFEGFLADAEAKRDQALTDKNLVDQVAQNALELKQNSLNSRNAVKIADDKMSQVASGIKKVMDQLIYSGEVLNKLANITVRKKKQNPLISDELITRISDAGKDTNTAIALTLVALQSTFTAQASAGEAATAAEIQWPKSNGLYDLLMGSKKSQTPSIKKLLDTAYTRANQNFMKARKASEEATKQLSTAQIKLNKAQSKLESLQAGLAAANAAALAS